jgi:putative tricarboxylic transport membrane protein
VFLIFQALFNLFNLQTIIALVGGTIGGIVIGALPGLSATMGVALLIPLTFTMNPAQALIMLASIYAGAVYGGSISAILIHTPGTPASAATAIDGYAMTKKGLGGKALGVSTVSSGIGGFISGLALLLIAPPLSKISLMFGPAEYFLLAVFGLTIIGSLVGDSVVKGLISGVIGLLVGSVGVDIISGYPRFTFGLTPLESGISFIPALIGLFSMSQVLTLSAQNKSANAVEIGSLGNVRVTPTLKELKNLWITILRSSIIGIIVGMLPGAGGDIASWVGYNEAKRFSKEPHKFGTGNPEGVAASEAANNAVCGGALIPLLTLGIPGSATTAVMLGGIMIQGLIPGRELFTKYADVTYMLIIGFILAQLVLVIVGLAAARYLPIITRVPSKYLAPIIIALCVIGSYAINLSLFDVGVMFFFGLLGYYMKKNGFHPAPVVLGIILGPMAEKGLRTALQLAQGNPFRYFLTSPLSDILIALILLSLLSPILMERFRRNQNIPTETSDGMDA